MVSLNNRLYTIICIFINMDKHLLKIENTFIISCPLIIHMSLSNIVKESSKASHETSYLDLQIE